MDKESELQKLSKEELIKRIVSWRNLIIPKICGLYGFQRPDLTIDFKEYYEMYRIGEVP